MKTAIITDSLSSCSNEMLKHPDLFCIVYHASFPDGTQFRDTNDLENTHSFFEKYRQSDDLPQSAQPSYADYNEIIQKIIAQNYERVILLHTAPPLTGIYNTALTIQAEYREQLEILAPATNTLAICIQEMVTTLLKSSLDELSNESILEQVSRLSRETEIYLWIGRIKSLVGGGRLQSNQRDYRLTHALTYLTEDATLAPPEMIRGERRMIRALVKRANNYLKLHPNGIKIHIYDADNLKRRQQVIQAMTRKLPHDKIKIIERELTPTLGVHTGPDAILMTLAPK